MSVAVLVLVLHMGGTPQQADEVRRRLMHYPVRLHPSQVYDDVRALLNDVQKETA